MPRSPNSLGALLREAKLAYQLPKVQVTLVQQTLPALPPVPEWKETRLVSLIHRSHDGQETYLGVFTELRNERIHARRLVPFNGAAPEGVPREFVTGDFWLKPKETPQYLDSPQEVEAIRQRFHELMEHFK